MSSTLRRAVTAAALIASAASATALAPASAVEARDSSRITVNSSDDHVSSGEQFVLRGRMRSEGDPVVGATVRVAYLDQRTNEWHPVRGAVVQTDSDGHYRVRVILQTTGDRYLRIRGNPVQDRIRVARAFTIVRVGR